MAKALFGDGPMGGLETNTKNPPDIGRTFTLTLKMEQEK